MKKNRGITLIELIISMALISIIIIFLFQLLVDAKFSDNRVDYAREDQQNRAIIIKRIQDDFLDQGGLVGIKDQARSDGLFIYFALYSGKTTKLTINSNSISYNDAAGESQTWHLKTKSENIGYNFNCVDYQLMGFNQVNGETEWGFYSVLIHIPLAVKSDSKNIIDDLEIFYLGKKVNEKGIVNTTGEAFPKKSYLGNYDYRKCN